LKLLQQDDFKKLKLDGPKAKFDRRRFVKGLKSQVPKFLLDDDTPDTRPKPEPPKADPAKDDPVLGWLVRNNLATASTTDPIRKKMVDLGVKTIADIKLMEPEDIRKLKLNKFDKRRFLAAQQSINTEQRGGMPRYRMFTEAPRPSVPLSSSALNLESARTHNLQIDQIPPMRHYAASPAVAMAQASKSAVDACRVGQGPSDTLDMFYDNWRSVQQVRNTTVYGGGFQSSAHPLPSGAVPVPGSRNQMHG